MCTLYCCREIKRVRHHLSFRTVVSCRTVKVLEHVREVETSPLGLVPGDFLRAAVPRIGELLGWLLLPHVMMGRYVLLLAPPLPQPPVEDMPGYDDEGYGIELYKDSLPMLSVGLQLMLLSGE